MRLWTLSSGSAKRLSRFALKVPNALFGLFYFAVLVARALEDKSFQFNGRLNSSLPHSSPMIGPGVFSSTVSQWMEVHINLRARHSPLLDFVKPIYLLPLPSQKMAATMSKTAC
jgi:hypothetical protein